MKTCALCIVLLACAAVEIYGDADSQAIGEEVATQEQAFSEQVKSDLASLRADLGDAVLPAEAAKAIAKTRAAIEAAYKQGMAGVALLGPATRISKAKAAIRTAYVKGMEGVAVLAEQYKGLTFKKTAEKTKVLEAMVCPAGFVAIKRTKSKPPLVVETLDCVCGSEIPKKCPCGGYDCPCKSKAENRLACQGPATTCTRGMEANLMFTSMFRGWCKEQGKGSCSVKSMRKEYDAYMTSRSHYTKDWMVKRCVSERSSGKSEKPKPWTTPTGQANALDANNMKKLEEALIQGIGQPDFFSANYATSCEAHYRANYAAAGQSSSKGRNYAAMQCYTNGRMLQRGMANMREARRRRRAGSTVAITSATGAEIAAVQRNRTATRINNDKHQMAHCCDWANTPLVKDAYYFWIQSSSISSWIGNPPLCVGVKVTKGKKEVTGHTAIVSIDQSRPNRGCEYILRMIPYKKKQLEAQSKKNPTELNRLADAEYRSSFLSRARLDAVARKAVSDFRFQVAEGTLSSWDPLKEYQKKRAQLACLTRRRRGPPPLFKEKCPTRV